MKNSIELAEIAQVLSDYLLKQGLSPVEMVSVVAIMQLQIITSAGNSLILQQMQQQENGAGSAIIRP